MILFSSAELNQIDHLWRRLPPDHMWSGWAATGETPERVWIFRTRAHWRRFPLTRTETGFALADEFGRVVAEAANLADLLLAVEAIPGLETLYQD
jgi:hypothetical protein